MVLDRFVAAYAYMGLSDIHRKTLKRNKNGMRYVRLPYTMHAYLQKTEKAAPGTFRYFTKNNFPDKHEFNRLLYKWGSWATDCLMSGKALELPWMLGHLYIGKFRPDFTNWRAKPYLWDKEYYRKTGKSRPINLMPTEGYFFCFKWKPPRIGPSSEKRFRFQVNYNMTVRLKEFLKAPHNYLKLCKHDFKA